MSLIERIIGLSQLPDDQLPGEAMELAIFSWLDWSACGIAGGDEPVAQAVRALAREEGGQGRASLIGGGTAPARMAAMVNGTTSHALDYDDTHFSHVGHLSVGIYPAALAVAEETDASARALVEAFLLGAEGAIRIGMVLGRSHYLQGYHQTATAGAFGATLAAGRLYGLDDSQMRHAIGLCATRASGLKCQFGTMGKPYNAGLAASNGVECAKLASLGVTSADDGLMGAQGFVPTHTQDAHPQAGWERPPPETFLFEDNKYKLHACCHGTHAMIEALLAAEALKGVGLNEIASFTLQTSPRWLNVCNIEAPRTGLEVKFSYRWLAAMTIRGDSTGDDRLYRDSLAEDPDLVDFARKVTVVGDGALTDLQAKGAVELKDGTRVPVAYDLAARLPGALLAEKLRHKAVAAIGERGNLLWESYRELEGKTARDLGALLRDVPSSESVSVA